MKILIDGAVFSQTQDQELIDFWLQLIPRVILRLREADIYYLNRNLNFDFPEIASIHNLLAPEVDYSLSALEDRRLASLCRELEIDIFISTYNTSAGSGVKTLFIDVENNLKFAATDDLDIISAKQRSLGFTSCYLALYQESIKSLAEYVNLPFENIQFIYADSHHELDWITIANFIAKIIINLATYQSSQELARIHLSEEEATQAEALQLRKLVYGEEAYKNYHLSDSFKIEQEVKFALARIIGLETQINLPNISDNYEQGDNWKLTTPVAFLIFNRPETTARVFEVIRQAKPPKLLVVADGPRLDKPGEAQKCNDTRAIINQIDWECEVLINFSEVNLGCRKRVSSGLDWIFEQVEEAIILEDDCLPHPSFFRYCQELLEKYRHDERMMMISGDNFQFGHNETEYSYYFSRYGHVWGWASWRRAWTKYDDSMQIWPELKDSGWLNRFLQNDQVAAYWSRIFQAVYDGFNTWDYIWVFTLWLNNGLTILPHVNLVSNIGFGSDGTHTTTSNSPFANMPVALMKFPLKHPAIISRNIDADDFTEQTQFSGTISPSSQIKIPQGNNKQSIQKCKVCKSDSHYFAKANILQKYDVNYFQCSNCGFVQTEDPYWLQEAYTDAIASTDVGLVFRNNNLSRRTAHIILNIFNDEAKFLDYGAGYGLFVRMMRDFGFDFYWYDKFCTNLFAKGFEYDTSNNNSYELVTAFEVFEHFANPVEEIENILKFSRNILFSTEILPENNPKPGEWWYYSPHEGQHISIYTLKTLSIIANKYKLNLYSNGSSLHLLTEKTLPTELFKNLCHSPIEAINKQSLLHQDYSKAVLSLLNSNPHNFPEANTDYVVKNPVIVVDGVFFQLYQTGIARVWKCLLEEWVKSGFVKHIVVLDRAGTSPQIPGIRYLNVPRYDYNNTDADREMLQKICDEEGADLFISTYYTTPTTTPSVFMAHDMIPELFDWDLNHPMWREKHYGIRNAVAYLAVSENTAKDLAQCFPDIRLESITIAKNGVDHQIFKPYSQNSISAFKDKYGINKPYFLLVGVGSGYKNGILFFRAFSQLASSYGFDIVCTGAGSGLAAEFRAYTSGSVVHTLQLSDEELAIAYSGAVALVYPSKYEGFGMPVIEAMACGCPVITCPNASIPEVAGEAAIYVNDDDVSGLANVLCEVQKPNVRQLLINAGLAQARKFTWSKMAEIVSCTLIDATLIYLNLKEINLIIFPDWSASEEAISLELSQVIKALAIHPDNHKTTLLIDISNFASEDAELLLSSVTMSLLMEEDLDITDGLQISLVTNLSDIQWKHLAPRLYGRIVLENEDEQAILKAKADTLKSYALRSFIKEELFLA